MMHINRFIDKMKTAEAKMNTNFIMSMREASDLHGDITKLLLALQELNTTQRKEPDEVTEIVIKDNDF